MTSLVAKAIETANAERNGALVGYLPLGYPDLETSIDAAIAMANNGADVIELGVPYSDPVMDGPVIQSATVQALGGGFQIRDVFTAVRRITNAVSSPVLVMTYWNPVLQHGVDAFAKELAAAGGAGLITPDITPEVADEWINAAKKYDLDHVFLAAPPSSDARLKLIAGNSRGFVYAVSTMGITGERKQVDEAAKGLATRLREAGAEHVCVGIGISTPEQVSEVVKYADGAIVGSAIVRALAEHGVDGVAKEVAALSAGTAA